MNYCKMDLIITTKEADLEITCCLGEKNIWFQNPMIKHCSPKQMKTLSMWVSNVTILVTKAFDIQLVQVIWLCLK